MGSTETIEFTTIEDDENLTDHWPYVPIENLTDSKTMSLKKEPTVVFMQNQQKKN